MSSNEFNELLNSLKSQPTNNNNSLQNFDEEALYVWKPVPIVSSPFKEINESVLNKEIPKILDTNITNPVSYQQQQTQSIAQMGNDQSQGSVFSYNPPSTIIQNMPPNGTMVPPIFGTQSAQSFTPSFANVPSLAPSTMYQSYLQNPHQYLETKPLNPINENRVNENKKNNFWVEWSIYIFGFALILFVIFFALWYFYVKDYNKIYPLQQAKNEQENFKLPPPSYLQPKIIEKNPHLNYENNDKNTSDEIKNPNIFIETMENAEELITESSDEIEYFKPETIMETLYEEKKLKEKKKKSYFDLSDVDSSEFETKETKTAKIDTAKLTDESDEVKKYAEKRSKLFST